MTLKFCPKCKTLLLPQRISGKEFAVKCLKCGYAKKFKGKPLIERSKIKHIKKEKGVVEDKNIFATYNHKCEKCGYGKAQVIDIGSFYSDEDYIIFLKCGKCGNVERIGEAT